MTTDSVSFVPCAVSPIGKYGESATGGFKVTLDAPHCPPAIHSAEQLLAYYTVSVLVSVFYGQSYKVMRVVRAVFRASPKLPAVETS